MDTFFIQALQNGFSVAVAGYLLVRMERRLEELARAIEALRLSLEGRREA
jgi:hypothetical protein